MPKCKPKYQPTDRGTCGKRIEKSVMITHAEKYSSVCLHVIS